MLVNCGDDDERCWRCDVVMVVRRFDLRLTGLEHLNFFLQSCFLKLEPNFVEQLCNEKLRLVQLYFSSNFFPIRTDGPKKKVGGQFCRPVLSLDNDGPNPSE